MGRATTPGGSRTSRVARRAARAISAAFIATVLVAGIALAWTDQTDNPSNSVQALTLGDPGSPNGVRNAGATTTCTNVTVSWTAAPAPVNTYKVESKTANGDWVVRTDDTGNVLNWVDTLTYTQNEVTYRVSGGYKIGGVTPTSWFSVGAVDASHLQCGTVGEVDDLAVTHACDATITWSAVFGATSYDRRYFHDGVLVTTTSNVAGTSWTDTVSHPEGVEVTFEVRPGIGTGNDGQWSNVATIPSWGCELDDLQVAHSCDAVLTWTNPANATRYDMRRRVDGGGWTTLATNQNILTFTDTTSHPENSTVEYQVRAGIGTLSDGKWTSVSIPSWGCEVTSFTLTEGCVSGAMTWSTTSNATTYDRRYRVNGGAWVTTSNVAGASWNDTVAKVAGGLVEYQVRPGIGTLSDGKWSSVATITDWGFYVTDVAFTNSSQSITNGDTITVTFNRPANTLKALGTNADTVYVSRGGTRAIVLGGTSTTAANMTIGSLLVGQNLLGSSTAFAGQASWINSTNWRWTRNVAGTTALTGVPTFTATNMTMGTHADRVTCAADGASLIASTPAVTGYP